MISVANGEVEWPTPRCRWRPPDHVPPERMVDFDFWNVPGSQEDIQLALRQFQQRAPDIFWSPHNCGHWTVMRSDDIDVMHHDYERFSDHCYSIPKKPDSTRARSRWNAIRRVTPR